MSRKKHRVEDQKLAASLPLISLVPSMVTILALCAGLSSIRFALNERWELATTFILIASLLDGMDGRLARSLNATSKFGAELDSLADFVNFGIAPAVVLYLWQDKGVHLHGMGWTLVLLYSACSAIRLARFNSNIDNQEIPKWKEHFFVGMPAPASAFMMMSPMVITFFYQEKFDYTEGFPFHIGLLGGYIICIALAMVSRIPMLSIKKMSVKREHVPMVLVLVVIMVALLIIETWATLTVLTIIYLITIPLTIIHYLRLRRQAIVSSSPVK